MGCGVFPSTSSLFFTVYLLLTFILPLSQTLWVTRIAYASSLCTQIKAVISKSR